MTDYDSPWKEALDVYFRQCMELFFPTIHSEIDWSRGHDSLDKEFQQVVREAEQGRRYVDKLVKVWTRDGAERWLLIHVEVQTTRDAEFPRRMYVYNYRIDDRYNREVVSLAILADDEAAWRPGSYTWERWGCRKRLDFPHAKLLDYTSREAELETSANPFARVVLAHLKTLETRDNDQARQHWKIRLVRGLYEQGFTADEVRRLFRLIDWLMDLPPALAGQFWHEVKQIQEERKMPFITTPERIGKEEGIRLGREEGIKLGREEGIKQGKEEGIKQGKEVGRRDGLLQAIEELLQQKFGEAGRQPMPQIALLSEDSQLLAVLVAIGTASTLDQAQRSWTTPIK